MNGPAGRRIKDTGAEAALFGRRAMTGFLLVALCLGVLLGRFAYLQIWQHDEFRARSEANRIKLRPLPPSRGLIYDRNGALLAENVPQYRLELIPEQSGDIDATLARLRAVIALDAEELERFAELRRLKRPFDSLPIKFHLREEEVARFAVRRHLFPGVEVVPYLTRSYPMGGLFAHAVGYVGRIDEGDRERLETSRYAGTHHIGKTGIERYYESRLLGRAGYEQVETDAQGRALRVLYRVAPHQGQHVYLTLDAKLQRAAADALEGRSGAVVAIDPRNGEVLALVSEPGFDPNLFVNGISRQAYADLLAEPHRPLFNRALQGGYEPGSTIKPFIALAGLELGIRTPADTVFSSGEFRIEGADRPYRDWKRGGHGRVDLREALAQSVNTYFYQLAVDMGVDRMSRYLAGFGFGAPTGLDLNGEGRGILPSREWKQATQGKAWYPGETVISGIGQGYWVVTPVQLASALATLAASGVRYTPHLLLATQEGLAPRARPPAPAPLSKLVQGSANAAAVREGMVAVMHGATGTARAVGAGSPYLIAGKSGTAQRYTRRDDRAYDETRVAESLRNRALFIAFAPAEAPQIAVAVVVEHGSSGSKAAAPVARLILDNYLLREGGAP